MSIAITIIQIAVSLALVVLILLQASSADAGGVFGGGGSFYHRRRGLEKSLFIATIALTALFAGLALLNLVLSAS